MSLTISEKLLLASYQLERRVERPFSPEELSIAAWKLYQEDFGLKGYVGLHPDNKKVSVSLAHKRGPVHCKWLYQPSESRYALTRLGLTTAKRLANEPDEPPVFRSVLAPRPSLDEAAMVRLLDHPVVARLVSEGGEELTFADACEFWGLAGDFQTYTARHLEMLTLLEAWKQLVPIVLADGRQVDFTDLRAVVRTDEYLQKKFARHIQLLLNRNERATV